MANNFKPWVDSPTAGQQVQSASVFATDAQRVGGFKAGNPASALRVNSALRQANIVVAGLMQMCDDIKTLPDGLSLMSTVTQVKNAIKAAIDTLIAATTDTLQNTLDAAVNDIKTLKNKVDAFDALLTNISAKVTALESVYTKTIGTSEWTGSSAPYSYLIAASTHKQGTKPLVSTFIDDEQVYNSPVIDASGNVMIRTNAKVNMRVDIR